MPELKLGNKFECFNCSTKFYDLGKSDSVCPKCGANQKDAVQSESAAVSQASRRKRKAEVAKTLDIEEDEAIETPDIADDDMVAPDLDADDDLEEEEDLDDDEV
jgi:uncharacterized protein (TIGR02300 family)